MFFLKQLFRLVCLFAFVVLVPIQGRADDSIAILGAGGIELLLSDRIAMVEQDLVLAPEKVTTRFLFRNEGKEDLTTLVAFVMPDIDPQILLKRSHDDFLGALSFTVTVNGRKVTPRVDIRAILGSKDVTDRLTEASVKLLPDDKEDDWLLLPQDTREELRKDGLVDSEVEGLPRWHTRLRLYWEQEFPAGHEVEILHGYVPFLGSESISVASLDDLELVKRYCIGSTQRTEMKKSLGEKHGRVRYLDYILSTAGNWKGNIERMAITVRKSGSAVATCLAGLVHEDEDTISVGLRNLKHLDDIRIMFVDRPEY